MLTACGAIKYVVICLVMSRQLMHTVQDITTYLAPVFSWLGLLFKCMAHNANRTLVHLYLQWFC